ncbi:tRNA pseudouridine(38-40) synthase TruA [Planctomicrobium sp. SH668]|uniref:tRNA pseudouridine(38-40) synthase TruA n=1 Tax=Planctomicrobium sp. SH668 TaxID=3448126 RepID=UPI003F5C4AE5
MTVPDTNNPPQKNIRIRIAYDGARYAGWQVQPNLETVQGHVEAAIQSLSGEEVRLLCAGRTDSGVHALGQVANFYTTSRIPAEKWRPALQTRLPEDIVILETDEVPMDFHATFSAKSKRYRYLILNRKVSDPFLKQYCWQIGYSLDVDAMQQAADSLLGTHDFRSFETNWPNKASSVRTIKDLIIQRRHLCEVFTPFSLTHQQANPPAGDGDIISIEIEADGFLYNMVRAITGTLVNVGRGSWTKEDVERILVAQDRSVAGNTAPAWGLFMVRVHYDEQNLGAVIWD